MTNTTPSPERSDLLEALTMHRQLLRQTAEGLTDKQARTRSTVSELTVGGIGSNPDIDWSNPNPAPIEAYRAGFRLLDTETLVEVLAD